MGDVMMVRKDSVKKSGVFFALVMILALFTFFKEVYATNNFLPTLSFVLLLEIMVFNFFLNDDDVFSPLSIFSIMYSGYAIGGYYYAGSEDYFGKFLEFINISREETVWLMECGLLYSIISYFFFGCGYVLFKKKIVFFDQSSGRSFWLFFSRYYHYLAFPFLFIGVVYWYWVAIVTAGGLIDMLIYFQAFRHLVADAQVSVLPYHFYYSGIYIWLLGLVVSGKKISLYFVVFSILGLVINLSQGRITLAITFLLSQLFFLALLEVKNRRKVFVSFVGLMALAFGVYFLRMLSNSVFIGSEVDVFSKSILETIVGGGNVADLQQLVIIFHTFELSNSLLGATYIDWFRNSIGVFFGSSPSSVGLTIKELYVPESSGAPTPGAIGEAYANFNFGAPLFIFFIGVAFSLIYRYVMSKGGVFLLLVYSVFLARFIFIYPKVDSTMMVNFLWGVTPFVMGVILLRIFHEILANCQNEK
ncbi:oligosaccharide repeat unit polymerase [Dasania sp. GY-MA-18]|uniref:O-antigen ligase n=1 Tax=Dasania phycosphaerae TaxID=2950436 RepID=A0A9J6RJG6_9GAMM|nr:MULTISPECIES: O-antigen polymerase [Dasania]MCR8922128.1 oligosaccharide repeat unit polymerase [Dasania sp. GY-MA-18]MCZ0864556.1 O-antigen ligase [Dasania phycosphaerae]MCZ0868284.1 O-antigen ligase [Dasania phycosphaerae]